MAVMRVEGLTKRFGAVVAVDAGTVPGFLVPNGARRRRGGARAQPVAAVVIALVCEFVVENILVGAVPAVGKWLTQGAGRALSLETVSNGSLLPAWAGPLVLLVYALAFSAVGERLLARRDVT